MAKPKLTPAPLTVAQLAELQSDVDGWPGEFRFAAEHTDDGDERFGVLLFDNGEDIVIGDRLDDDVGKSLARMLNATGPLLAMLKLGGGR